VAPSPKTRFQEIADDLIGQILRGELAAGAMFPSERQLQESYEVSRTTVRRAIAELVAAGYGENVAHRGVTVKRPPKAERLKIVAFVDHASSIHRSLFFALSQRLAVIGYHLVHVDSAPDGTVGAIENANRQNYAAAFVWPKNAFTKPGALAHVRSEMPIIAVDHGLDGEETDLVMNDHMGGAHLAVGHLLDLGRRNIALTGFYTQFEDVQQRINGYFLAHYDRDMSPGAHNLVFSSPAHLHFEDPRLLAFRLQEADRPDAVFVLHDMSVAPVVETIAAAGLRIPEDVALISFGNDVPISFGQFGLSTVAMNWDEVARRLVERMQLRIANPSAAYSRTISPVRLIVRGSCGAPSDRWQDDLFEPSSMTILSRMDPSSRDRSRFAAIHSPTVSRSSGSALTAPDVETPSLSGPTEGTLFLATEQ